MRETGKAAAELRAIPRLDAVIQLVGERSLELSQDTKHVHPLPRCRVVGEEARQLVEELDVIGQQRADVRPLHLHDHVAPVGQAGGMCLAQAGRA